MNATIVPMFQKDWDKLNKDAISGDLQMVLSGELSGVSRSKPRSRAGQIVHGMSNYIGFLCTFDVPLATQIILLRKWIRWGFDISRPSYLKYVKEILGDDEYLAYQKRAWMCQRFEAIRAAKLYIDKGDNVNALELLTQRRVVGEFSNRFGNQLVSVSFSDTLEFIKIYDHRGFFTTKNINGNVSFVKFQENHSTYLKAMMSDLGKTGIDEYVKREREIVNHAMHKTGVLSDTNMPIESVVAEANKRALSNIDLNNTGALTPESTKNEVDATDGIVAAPVTSMKERASALNTRNENPILSHTMGDEFDFFEVLKTKDGKSVKEEFWAFQQLSEAEEEPFKTDIKSNDLVLTYGLEGKFFAYRKDDAGSLILIDKLSMHPLLQADFDDKRQKIKPSDIMLMIKASTNT